MHLVDEQLDEKAVHDLNLVTHDLNLQVARKVELVSTFGPCISILSFSELKIRKILLKIFCPSSL